MPKLKKEIMELFHEKLDWKPQTIRDNVSRFKIKECPHSTQNAAAHVLLLTKGFSCDRKLDKKDRASLPQNQAEIVKKYRNKKHTYTRSYDYSNSITRKIMKSVDPLERGAWKNSKIYP